MVDEAETRDTPDSEFGTNNGTDMGLSQTENVMVDSVLTLGIHLYLVTVDLLNHQ